MQPALLLLLLLLVVVADVLAATSSEGAVDTVCMPASDPEWNPTKVVVAPYNASRPVGAALPVHIIFDGPAMRLVMTLSLGNSSDSTEMRFLADTGSSVLASCPGSYETEDWLRSGSAFFLTPRPISRSPSTMLTCFHLPSHHTTQLPSPRRAPGYPGFQDAAFAFPTPNSYLQLIYAIVVSYGGGSHGCELLFVNMVQRSF